MKYLTMPDAASAEQRSREEALPRGCAPDATTQTWWAWAVDPETGAACLLIEDGDDLRPGETASATPPEWL